MGGGGGGVMKKDGGREGKGGGEVERGKMQREECGPLETTSSVALLQALTENSDAMLREKTCLALRLWTRKGLGH